MEIQQLADKRNVDVDINKISNDITVVGLKDDVRQLRDKINTILHDLSGNFIRCIKSCKYQCEYCYKEKNRLRYVDD